MLVDDDKLVLSSLRRVLDSIPLCRTETFLDSLAAAEYLKSNEADLLVADYVMPGLDGLGLIEQVRLRHPDMAVLLISGVATLEMMQSACRLGTTDVLFKPISAQALLDSVHWALEKRNAAIQRSSLVAFARHAMDILSTSPAASPEAVRPPIFPREGSLEMDLASNQLTFNGRTLELSGYEYLIMEILMRRQGQLVTHNEIRRHITGAEEPKNVASDLVRGHIARLRRKIEKDPSRPRLLRSVWGKGYILSLEFDSEAS
ncbi:MAG: response regulator transcription factor [Polyangia bacterium]|nr:response regulator transcription factor [Polyangia bacterium]